ncbi:hypothetical protein PR048_006769 [Dryococelus australis]|uniref:Uncharacterized protein n=1 Tax=Dryococelus australis TaxID=614101 RepID=A0ABQ9ID40_9NEOP|nr:hypothetical protein PR048_006769 [Dryococelus australis]
MKGWGKRDIPRKPADQRHDSDMRQSGVTRPGIEPGSPWWEASTLTAQPPWPPGGGDFWLFRNKLLQFHSRPGLMFKGALMALIKLEVALHKCGSTVLVWSLCRRESRTPSCLTSPYQGLNIYPLFCRSSTALSTAGSRRASMADHELRSPLQGVSRVAPPAAAGKMAPRASSTLGVYTTSLNSCSIPRDVLLKQVSAVRGRPAPRLSVMQRYPSPTSVQSMSRQSQCSRVLQVPSSTVGFTRRFHTLSTIQATNTSLAVVLQSPVVVHTSLRSCTLASRHLESSPTRVMRRGGLRRQPVSPEHSCVVAKRIGNSTGERRSVTPARVGEFDIMWLLKKNLRVRYENRFRYQGQADVCSPPEKLHACNDLLFSDCSYCRPAIFRDLVLQPGSSPREGTPQWLIVLNLVWAHLITLDETFGAMLPDLPVFDCHPCVGGTSLPRSGRVAWCVRSAVLARTCKHRVELRRYLLRMKSLGNTLRIFCQSSQQIWSDKIKLVDYMINHNVHEPTTLTQCEVLTGQRSLVSDPAKLPSPPMITEAPELPAELVTIEIN